MEPHDRDQFDELLDGALRHYGEVAPRAGLEGRVLARLKAADRQSHSPMRWVWGLAAAATAIVALVLLPRTFWSHQHLLAVHPPSAVVRPEPKNGPEPTNVRKAAHSSRRSVGQRHKISPELASIVRRPSEFPSPHPLTEQERLLKAYVNNFPHEAALVAREQAQREKELAEMGWKNPGSTESN
jgi:hypothetical protein